MIRATGNEMCSRCGGGVRPGEELLEGSPASDDAGALYHAHCYSALCREESGEPDDEEAPDVSQ